MYLEYLKVRDRNLGVIDSPENHYSWKSCCFLTDEGCKLPYDKRPSGCKLLIPELGVECHTAYTEIKCTMEWSNYVGILKNLNQHFSKIEVPPIIV